MGPVFVYIFITTIAADYAKRVLTAKAQFNLVLEREKNGITSHSPLEIESEPVFMEAVRCGE